MNQSTASAACESCRRRRYIKAARSGSLRNEDITFLRVGILTAISGSTRRLGSKHCVLGIEQDMSNNKPHYHTHKKWARVCHDDQHDKVSNGQLKAIGKCGCNEALVPSRHGASNILTTAMNQKFKKNTKRKV